MSRSPTALPPTSTAVSTSRSSSPSTFAVAVAALTWRELVRFFRQRTRVVGAVGQPVIFWVLFGAGLQTSFRPPQWAPATMTYQEFFLPGITALIVLFTAIFSTISIIEDRREGFLQGVLVAPVPRIVIVLGKLFGGTILAVLQAALFLLLGPLLTWIGLAPSMNISITPLILLQSVGFVALVAFTLTALGYCIAWPMDSTQGFHAIMSVFLMPLWLLSGAFFPPGSGWVGWIINANPLTYGVAGIRRSLYPPGTFGPGLPGWGMCIGVSMLFCAVSVALAVLLTNRRRITAA